MVVEDVLAASRTPGLDRPGRHHRLSAVFGDGDDVFATITYRILAVLLETRSHRAARNGGRRADDLADVTSQLVDLDARIRNLKASETALVGYLANATRWRSSEIESRMGCPGPDRTVDGPAKDLDRPGRVRDADRPVQGPDHGHRGRLRELGAGGRDRGRGPTMVLGFLQALATAGIWFVIVWLPILLVLGRRVAACSGRLAGSDGRHPPTVPPAPPAVAGADPTSGRSKRGARVPPGGGRGPRRCRCPCSRPARAPHGTIRA